MQHTQNICSFCVCYTALRCAALLFFVLFYCYTVVRFCFVLISFTHFFLHIFCFMLCVFCVRVCLQSKQMLLIFNRLHNSLFPSIPLTFTLSPSLQYIDAQERSIILIPSIHTCIYYIQSENCMHTRKHVQMLKHFIDVSTLFLSKHYHNTSVKWVICQNGLVTIAIIPINNKTQSINRTQKMALSIKCFQAIDTRSRRRSLSKCGGTFFLIHN